MCSKINVLKDFPTLQLCLPTASYCRIPRKFRGGDTVFTVVPRCSPPQRALEASSVTHKTGESNSTANLRCILNHPSLLSGLQFVQLSTRSSVLLGSWTWHLTNGAPPAGPSLGPSWLPQEQVGVWDSGGDLSMEGATIFPGGVGVQLHHFSRLFWVVHPFWCDTRHLISPSKGSLILWVLSHAPKNKHKLYFCFDGPRGEKRGERISAVLGRRRNSIRMDG